jgi:4-hydroxybenzoate polyprenyltransferase
MVKSFLNIIRLPNILLVIATQLLMYKLVIEPPFSLTESQTNLSNTNLFLLILSTSLITISGYLINDIYDREIDSINKPERHWIKTPERLRTAWLGYFFILAAGTVISAYLAFSIDQLWWFLLYPLASFLLFFYAIKLKSTALLGNIVVSLFCSGVVGILLFAEWNGFEQLMKNEHVYAIWGFHVLVAYMIFAFFSNLIREIVKDIEDLEGDQKLKARTFPIVFGVPKSKILILLLTAFMILSLMVWLFIDLTVFDNLYSTLVGIGQILCMIIFLIRIVKAEDQRDFGQLSALAKVIMASGLVMLILLKLSYG